MALSESTEENPLDTEDSYRIREQVIEVELGKLEHSPRVGSGGVRVYIRTLFPDQQELFKESRPEMRNNEGDVGPALRHRSCWI